MICIQPRRGGREQPDGDVVCQNKPEETGLKLYAVTDKRFRSITSATSAGLLFFSFSVFARGGCYCFSI